MGRYVRVKVRGEVIKGGLVGGGGDSQVVRQPDLSRLSQLCASQSGLTLEYFQSMFPNYPPFNCPLVGISVVVKDVLPPQNLILPDIKVQEALCPGHGFSF